MYEEANTAEGHFEVRLKCDHIGCEDGVTIIHGDARSLPMGTLPSRLAIAQETATLPEARGGRSEEI